jgi:hypothetical protein
MAADRDGSKVPTFPTASPSEAASRLGSNTGVMFEEQVRSRDLEAPHS